MFKKSFSIDNNGWPAPSPIPLQQVCDNVLQSSTLLLFIPDLVCLLLGSLWPRILHHASQWHSLRQRGQGWWLCLFWFSMAGSCENFNHVRDHSLIFHIFLKPFLVLFSKYGNFCCLRHPVTILVTYFTTPTIWLIIEVDCDTLLLHRSFKQSDRRLKVNSK